MDFYEGIRYNIRGFFLALKTPGLLMLGILRFGIVLILAVVLSGLIFYWQDEILMMIWQKPVSGWLIYLWKAVSMVLSMVLAGISVIMAYLISQIVFGVFIMDYMSRITEKIILGKEVQVHQGSWFSFFIYLIKQELPRTIIPVIITFMIMFLGLFTPAGPVVLVFSAMAAAVFLAWDNTDLVPARRMYPFKTRIRLLKKNILFHAGFGILFLIPFLNIVLLSFAPVGATLYFIEKEQQANGL